MGEYLESGDLAAIDANVLTELINMNEADLRKKLEEYTTTFDNLGISTEEYVDSMMKQIQGLTREEAIAN